jgi:hypothetical protein
MCLKYLATHVFLPSKCHSGTCILADNSFRLYNKHNAGCRGTLVPRCVEVLDRQRMLRGCRCLTCHGESHNPESY